MPANFTKSTNVSNWQIDSIAWRVACSVYDLASVVKLTPILTDACCSHVPDSKTPELLDKSNVGEPLSLPVRYSHPFCNDSVPGMNNFVDFAAKLVAIGSHNHAHFPVTGLMQ